MVARRHLDHAQRQVVAALAGTAQLLVVEGAAGAGKTTTLAAARELLEMQERRLVVVTPTLKAAQVAEEQVGAAAFTAAWLVHQHGFRWDDDGHWTRDPVPRDARRRRRGCCPATSCSSTRPACSTRTPPAPCSPSPTRPGARVALVGDRHQLPAVGRGGVLDHAARWARPEARLELETVHRFTDPDVRRPEPADAHR